MLILFIFSITVFPTSTACLCATNCQLLPGPTSSICSPCWTYLWFCSLSDIPNSTTW